MAQLSQQYQVNAVTIAKWKSEALENLSTVFKGKQNPDQTKSSVEIEKLYAQIGHLKVENDFLKKSARKLGNSGQRIEMVDQHHKQLSIRNQCELLSVPRSSLYYAPVEEKPENIQMMNLMDNHLIQHPTEGVLSMVYWLKEKGFPVGPKRIRRLFRLMGYEAIYRKKNLTKGALKEFVKPYLLHEELKSHEPTGLVHRYYLHPNGKGFYVYDSIY